MANYSVVQLTEKARPLLRGEQSLVLARPRVKVTAARKAARRKPEDLEVDPQLFEQLRALRKRLADKAGLPPFVIFSDATLAEMAALRQADRRALLEINGVGEAKLQRYGGAFLAVISGKADLD